MTNNFTKELNRLDAVKQLFYAFRDSVERRQSSQEIIQREQQMELGLLAFDDSAEIIVPCSSNLNTFEQYLDVLGTRGMTDIPTAVQ